jgi:release factor glutamine methyltransferase
LSDGDFSLVSPFSTFNVDYIQSLTSIQDYAIVYSKIGYLTDTGDGEEGGTTLGTDWTVREILKWTRDYFKKGGIVQPRLEAEILLAHVLNVDRLHLYLSPDKPLTLDERARFRETIKRRRSGVPLQHLIGEVSFFGLPFRVSKEALIPRPETEELVEKALGLAPRDREITCLDLGTGSGVLAICLARYLPLARVTAVDLSAQALTLARENAELNGVSDRITFLESDWFTQIEGKFDLIVSNPPYIAEEELVALSVEVRQHEPRVALDGGKGGTEKIDALTRDVREHMRSGARLLLEIGDGQGTIVVERITQVGLVEARIERDLAGKERFVIARCP